MNLTPIFSVHEFNEVINQHLRLLDEVTVEGEISQMQISQGKWLFMTIKDDRASVGVFGMVFKLSGVNALEEGMKVRVTGHPGLYQRSGRFNINATSIVPAGEGALRQAYERLKKQLYNEGLFDSERKRKLPRFPEKIGLITAQGSKAYSDFVKVLQERMGGLEISFYPVQVQGANAVPSIIKAFEYFNKQKNMDVIIMTRGGGSLEDLMSFNDESVARAVFASKIPVVSAIGHEEDVALTDFVADSRASTPSNAAELLVMSRSELSAEINRLNIKLNHGIDAQLREMENATNYQILVLNKYFDLQKNLIKESFGKVSIYIQHYKQNIMMKEQSLTVYKNRLTFVPNIWLDNKQKKVDGLERLLKSLDPEYVLKRGFSITRNSEGKIINNITDISKEDKIITTLSGGSITSQVTEILKK